MLYQHRKIIISVLAILVCVFALTSMTPVQRYVAAPGFACAVMMLWLWLTLWTRDRQVPFFDVGVLCALATLVYTIYPLLNYWLDGMQFGILSDNRLRQYDITPQDLGIFHMRHVVYLFSFIACYSMFRGRSTLDVVKVHLPNRSTQQLILFLFLLLTGYFIVLQVTAGVDFNASYDPDTFGSNVSALASLPLPLLQLSGKLWGILFIVKLALLVIVVGRCGQRRWLVVLAIWMAAEIVHGVLLKGSRTGMVLLLMAAILLYHRMIKRLSMKFLCIAGTALFVFFIFLGLYRSYIDFTTLQAGLAESDGGLFSGGNEFQALLGTAYDILQFKESGVELPWYLNINDFISLLPPQQFVPFEKVSGPEWYLRQIGMSGTGRGYMWGVISQSIVGLDWLELALRGALLGYILARVHRWYTRHQAGFIATLLYVFLCLKVYYTFRDTTFSLLANIAWEFLPFYLMLRFWHAMNMKGETSHFLTT